MALELLLFVVAGCLLGVFTGAVPGLHVNTISLLVLGFAATGDIGIILLIASMSIVHTFVDFVPSVLLGAPSDETFLAVLPGHRMLLQGQGLAAVQLTVVGGLFAGLAAIAIGPLFIGFVEKGRESISAAIPFVLSIILLLMLLEEGEGKKKWAFAAIVLSAALGLLALRGPLPIAQPLFCLATGFFAASTLLCSIGKRQELGEQSSASIAIGKARAAKSSLLGLLAGALVSLFPGIGASQAAFVIRRLSGRIKTADYLVLLGSVNTVNMLFSFFVLFAWGKTRTGSAAAIKQLSAIGPEQIWFIAAACLFALGFAAIATGLVARLALKKIRLIGYRKINSGVLLLIVALVALLSGLLGLLVFAAATAIGLLALFSGVKRSNCMAFLMVPTILFYLGL